MYARILNALIALLLAGFSGLVAWAALDVVIKESRGSLSTLGPITRGFSQYALLVPGSKKKECFGYVALHLQPDQAENQLTIDGQLTFSFRGQTFAPEIGGKLTFNPIGQLGASLIKITLGEQQLSVGTKNINPFTLSLASNAQGRQFNFQFVIPGPIELRRRGDATYALVSDLFKPLSAGVGSKGQSEMTRWLPPPRLVEEGMQACPASKRRALGVDSFVSAAAGQASQLESTLSRFLNPG